MLRPAPTIAPGSALITAFPILALIGTGVALSFPEYVLILKPAIVPLLGVVMFGMGLTLRAEDFLAVLARPGVIALGVALQFALMPMLAWVVGKAMVLDIEPFIGLILLGACPGGTASNVICYLARANVALSITLTAVSTLLAVLLTPYLTFFFAGHLVPVPIGAMLFSILKIVVAPVAAGVVLNHLLGRYLGGVRAVFPGLSVGAIVVIIAIVVALNTHHDAFIVFFLIVAVILHNSLGLAAGYAVPLFLGYDQRTCRTLAIEVGMQNSGLAVALATQFFSPAAALPGAIFSIWHNLSGAGVAAFWARRPVVDGDEIGGSV